MQLLLFVESGFQLGESRKIKTKPITYLISRKRAVNVQPLLFVESGFQWASHVKSKPNQLLT